MKIIKIVATRCHILMLKCTKFDFGWGSAPDPAGGAYSAPQAPGVLYGDEHVSGQLSSGKRPQCGPVRRYKDTVKTNMKRCGLRPQSLSTAPFDRAQWRTTCQSATASLEESRVAELDRKRAARKQQVINTTGTVWPCDRCSRTCSSRIGLFAHRRTHR